MKTRRFTRSVYLLFVVLLIQAGLAAATNGTASYSQTINYGGSLYYYITGGPPNTCGELDTYRNGSWLISPGWVCTDANGNATKGPWYWSNTPSEQTDDPTFIKWPDGSTTNSTLHIWDKTCATTYRDSYVQAPPTAYNGHASDVMYGAGFDFSPHAYSTFADTTYPTSPLYWVNSSVGYSATSAVQIPATLSHANRWYVYWTTNFPATYNHQHQHSYTWTTCVDDGYCSKCVNTYFYFP
jgi:hypothetical protein